MSSSSSSSISEIIVDDITKIMITGHTGSGKTSLINLLQNKPLEPLSILSGTSIINLQKYNDEIVIIDTPGFGDIGHTEVTDETIIQSMKDFNNISCVFCCIALGERFPKTFALNICEMMHLYDIQLSNFVFVCTKFDLIKLEEREKAKNKISSQLFEVFGWIKIVFTGVDILDDLKTTMIEIVNMPKFNPLKNYIPTNTLQKLIIKAQRGLINGLIDYKNNITDQTLKLEYETRLTGLSTKLVESKRKWFNSTQIQTYNDIITETREKIKKLSHSENKSKEMELYQKHCSIIDKEKAIRTHRVRYVLKLLKEYDSYKSDGSNHSAAFLEACEFLKKI